eukprot:scaffold85778_cov19-Tisochrysis_lutea.AAC.1
MAVATALVMVMMPWWSWAAVVAAPPPAAAPRRRGQQVKANPPLGGLISSSTSSKRRWMSCKRRAGKRASALARHAVGKGVWKGLRCGLKVCEEEPPSHVQTCVHIAHSEGFHKLATSKELCMWTKFSCCDHSSHFHFTPTALKRISLWSLSCAASSACQVPQ